MVQKNILIFNTALFLRAFLLLSPIILLFYQENGLSMQTLFLFQGIFYLTSIMAEFPIGYLSNVMSSKCLLLNSFIIFLSIILLWLYFRGFYIILFGEILFAISKVMMDNVMSSYLYDYLNTNNQEFYMPKYYGYLQFFLALGTAMSGIIGSFIYKKHGSKILLIMEFIIIFIAALLLLCIKNIKKLKRKPKIQNFIRTSIKTYTNNAIKYYILYSGLLTSCSILFVLSFQPIMQKAMFPVIMFGFITFCNHGIRAISGLLTGISKKLISIRQMVIPLYIMYILGFSLIIMTQKYTNIFLITILLIIICIIIGIQLLFTTRHISRLHKFISLRNRGSMMFINNSISRFMTAVILILSKIYMDKLGFCNLYIFAFIMFIIFGTYIMIKTFQIKEIA